MTGNGQLKRGAFIINDFLRNPHFSDLWLGSHFKMNINFAMDLIDPGNKET